MFKGAFIRFVNWLKEDGRLRFILFFIDKIGIKKYLVHGADFRKVIEDTKEGDCILIRAFLESTTYLQGSKFTHAAMKVADKFIIDATGEGVEDRDILELMVGSSRVMVRRPKVSPDVIKEMVSEAYGFVDRKTPYDWSFVARSKNPTPLKDEKARKAVYCSEMYYWCLESASPGLLNLRERFGIMTITPDDIAKADNVFETIIDIRGEKHG